MTTHSQHFIQQRKLYMALPVLVTPFLVMIFWALGGGTAASKPVSGGTPTKGLITTLPDAQLEGREQWDKLSLYEQAKTDSVRYEEARQNDPYFDLAAFKTSKPAEQQSDEELINTFRNRDRQEVDQIEAAVQQKLEHLQKVIRQPEPTLSKQASSAVYDSRKVNGDQTLSDHGQIEQMEAMMNLLGEKNREPDPEMQQIEGVLEKILDIQHPERLKERLSSLQQAEDSKALRVETISDDDITLLTPIDQPENAEQRHAGNNTDKGRHRADIEMSVADSTFTLDNTDQTPETSDSRYVQNGFFGLVDSQLLAAQSIADIQARTAVNAVIHDTQELVAGSTVRIRLTEEVAIAGIALPKDQFVYGECEINGERLTVKINSIRLENTLLPVALTAYDLDGLEGVHMPGAITRDAARQGSADAMQSMQMMSLNPSIGAQAAGAGIEAAKGLLTKKARLVKVTVKAGYQILLKSSDSSLNQ